MDRNIHLLLFEWGFFHLQFKETYTKINKILKINRHTRIRREKDRLTEIRFGSGT